MKLLIGYATKEGQTRKIARHVADRAVDAGHSVELLALKDAGGIEIDRFDAVMLAAPIHVGHYPKALIEFASAHADKLAARSSRFISVSLAAAGHEADDWRNLDNILGDFSAATGWRPEATRHVAGAYLPSTYDLFTRLIMKRIISAKDPDAEIGKDKEYTDWEDLDNWVDGWLAR
ncbi:flavodoxin domain-containing protein [Henriciella marina]|uniref:flavodoxin domain-containing protein n=1 Tax=Henriciella marina TaxID=453851 RepID=UPI00058ABEB0|nr:flavodoxin domain-containing protein [Henriciella marina]